MLPMVLGWAASPWLPHHARILHSPLEAPDHHLPAGPGDSCSARVVLGCMLGSSSFTAAVWGFG